MPEKPNKPSKPFVVINPFLISWKNVIIGLLVGTTLIGAGLVGYYYFQLKGLAPPLPISFPRIATPSAQKDEAAGWKTYTSTDRKYTFKYPSNWVVNNLSGGVTVLCGGSVKTCESSDNVDLFQVLQVSYKSIDEYTSKTKDSFTEQEKTAILGLDAVRSTTILEGMALGQAGGSSITWFVISNGQVYTLEYRYPKVETKNRNQIFDKANPDILSTFKFID